MGYIILVEVLDLRVLESLILLAKQLIAFTAKETFSTVLRWVADALA